MNSITEYFASDRSSTAEIILAQNAVIARHGLVISPADARSIAERHAASLSENRLVEIGAGSVERIIGEFSGSPYVHPGNFASVVEAMVEAFCYLKREADKEVSDRAVISAMRAMFDDVSCGSEELFLGRELEILLRYLREGRLTEDGLPDYAIREEDNYGAEPDCSY